MNYRIYDKNKRNIKGSAMFKYNTFEVSFGKAFDGKVIVKGGFRNTEDEHEFKDMESAMKYINEEIQWTTEMDD